MLLSTRKVPYLFLFLVAGPLWVSEAFHATAPSLFTSKTGLHPALQTKPISSLLPASHEASQGEVTSSKKSLVLNIDNAGLSLKRKAVKMDEKIDTAPTKWKKYAFLLQACLLYSLFIIYRGSRGFFVVLPTVMRHVYSKLEVAVESPFEQQPEQQHTTVVPWQTRVTVSILASVLTASYVIRGAVRVTKKLVSSAMHKTNVTGAFALAAEEQEANEMMIARMAGSINGEKEETSSTEPATPSAGRLAP